MALVAFEVVHQFDAASPVVWRELTDWRRHADWVPMTRVEVGPGDPTSVGSTFTAWTGPGPVALEDRMRVTVLDWDETSTTGRCEVAKLGPVLKGRAGFTVSPAGTGSEVRWLEEVTVPLVPRLLAPLVGGVGAAVFRLGMRRLGRLVGGRPAAAGG
jgi:hypothetical protein